MIPESLSAKLRDYQPSQEGLRIVSSVEVVLLVGISGAGKDTVKHHLLTSGRYHHIVSHTTRPPRQNKGVLEENGVDYHFIDYDTATHMLEAHGFMEAKQYGTNVYGTSIGEFQLAHDEGKIAITDLEVQGVAEYMRLAPAKVRPVFLLPPDYDTWQQRLLRRYGSDLENHKQDIDLRIQTSIAELEELLQKDYYFAVVNNDLDQTVQIVDQIAQTGQQAADQKQQALAVAQAILSQIKARS